MLCFLVNNHFEMVTLNFGFHISSVFSVIFYVCFYNEPAFPGILQELCPLFVL